MCFLHKLFGSFKSNDGAYLKTEKAQPAAAAATCQHQREDNSTRSPSCQGQVHSQLDRTWSLPACLRVVGGDKGVGGVVVWEQSMTGGILTTPVFSLRLQFLPHPPSSLPFTLLHLPCLSLLLVAARGSGPENSHRETNQHLHITARCRVCRERIN